MVQQQRNQGQGDGNNQGQNMPGQTMADEDKRTPGRDAAAAEGAGEYEAKEPDLNAEELTEEDPARVQAQAQQAGA